MLSFTKCVRIRSLCFLGMKVQFYVDISRMTGCIFGVFAFEILDNWSGPGKKELFSEDSFPGICEVRIFSSHSNS